MAFTSWYSRRWRRGGRYSRYGRSRSSRRARGQLRAAIQQRDSLSVVIKYASLETVTTDLPNSSSFGFYKSIYAVLASSPMFTAFQNMYDQVKIDGVQVQVTQRSSEPAIQNVNNPLSIITAWDRSGLSSTVDPNGAVVNQSLNYATVSQYSSAIVKPALFGTTYRTSRMLYPSTLAEKSQWVSTGSLSYDPVGQAEYDSPLSVVESGSYKFKPIFILSMISNVAVPNANTNVGSFYVEYSIPVTFRGLRKITQ